MEFRIHGHYSYFAPIAILNISFSFLYLILTSALISGYFLMIETTRKSIPGVSDDL